MGLSMPRVFFNIKRIKLKFKIVSWSLKYRQIINMSIDSQLKLQIIDMYSGF